ncbi:hypothetical protein [Sphingomonas sp. Leaf37]|uniref:hypothetical protein n=1 Tax=Sphingomonas sp. Leaf37 TaxID=2876552 RepID=UPI001E38659C|nr:hypothetical protein [Sphingomonas sp. Leaf37]
MAWYRNGTVAVTNGSATVTGAGTDFVSNVKIGEIFVGPDRGSYEVAAIVSATQLTLAEPYQGPGGGGQGYKIAPTASFARDLALAFSGFKNTFGGILDTIGQGMFSDGTSATPGMRFASDQDTGFAKTGSNTLAVVTGGVERAIFDGSGNATFQNTKGISVLGSPNEVLTMWDGQFGPRLATAGTFRVTKPDGTTEMFRVDGSQGFIGVGTATPATSFHISRPSANVLTIQNTATTDRNTQVYFSGRTGIGWRVGVDILGVDEDAFGIFKDGTGPMLKLDTTGSMIVGVSNAPCHTIARGQGDGVPVLNVSGLTAGSAFFYSGGGQQGSAAACAAKVASSAVTGRSINAGGTINASGADYAEYMLKSNGCGHIAKGDVCGVDADGRLTKSWAAAKSFVVKSTDPAYVGGDSWADHLPPKPEAPGAAPVAPVAPIAPASLPPEPVLTPREDGEDDESFTARAAVFFAASAAQDALMSEHAAYNDAVAAFPGLLAAHGEAHAGWEAAKAAYEVDLPAWEADLEKARQCVDRIAFAGQVPVNIAGDFAVGDYLIATNTADGGITMWAIAEADITFDQYRRRLGKVWAIREGRPWVDVQHG